MNKQTTIIAAEPETLRLWNAVSKTDPKHTKKVTQRGGFTAISAHYQIMTATEQFGPIGLGWGYTNGEPIFQDNLIIVPVTLWHGERSNTFGPVYGGAEWKSGTRLDSDAAKKASTDGLTKALSQLGFNADVFLGRFDDNKYVAEVTAEFAEADEEAGRGKVAGISKIKKALNALMLAGNTATELAAFNALVHDCKAELTAIKDGNHVYWTGDGEDSEGFKAWIVRRRAELTPIEQSLGFQMLVSALEECACRDDLAALFDQHGAVVEALDDAESRKFGHAYDAREAAIMAVAPLSAG